MHGNGEKQHRSQKFGLHFFSKNHLNFMHANFKNSREILKLWFDATALRNFLLFAPLKVGENHYNSNYNSVIQNALI